MAKKIDTIDIGLHHQDGDRSPTGGETRERFTVDFLINGVSMHSMLEVGKRGHVSRFAADRRQGNQEAVEIFLMTRSPDLDEYAILFECSCCGDAGCGVYMVKITRSEDGYIWSEFGYDQGWFDQEIPQRDFETYEDVGPFTFEAGNYEKAIRAAGEGFADLHVQP